MDDLTTKVDFTITVWQPPRDDKTPDELEQAIRALNMGEIIRYLEHDMSDAIKIGFNGATPTIQDIKEKLGQTLGQDCEVNPNPAALNIDGEAFFARFDR